MAELKARPIHCPKCAYRPAADNRWVCRPGCGATYNTFWTRGLCPGCAKQWQYTWCPSCGKPSPHKRWYRQRKQGAAPLTLARPEKTET